MAMKALTVWQLWASLFFIPNGKDLDNRTRRTHYRGQLAIHAATVSRLTRPEMERVVRFLAARNLAAAWALASEWIHAFATGKPSVPFGAIIGVVDLVDCVEDSDSPWFTGPYGWVRANPVLLPTPVRCKGKLGLWDLPAEVEAAVREQLEGEVDHG